MRFLSALFIVLLCIGAAIVYGILHDQITARICVEYFTIGHPPIGTDDPTLLAFAWGVIATWWAGLIIGLPLAIAAQAGSAPPVGARSLVRPIAVLLGVMAVCATLAGIVGNWAARQGAVTLLEPMASRVPPARHVAFLTDLWIHNGSYLSGFVGGFVLAGFVCRNRWQSTRSVES